MELKKKKSYILSKKSINKAVYLLRKNRVHNFCMKSKEKTAHNFNIMTKAYCINSLFYHTHKARSIFSRNILLSKMRDCLQSNERHMLPHLLSLYLDWNQVKYANTKMLWKYAVMIMLYLPRRDINDIVEFLKICIGCRNNTEMEHMLKEMLTFPATAGNTEEDLRPIVMAKNCNTL